jgi:hypothetical protein
MTTEIQSHNHKHQGLDPLIHSVSRVTAARANASSVFQLFSFLAVCSGMISKGFGFVAFFASVKASSIYAGKYHFSFCHICWQTRLIIVAITSKKPKKHK